MSIIRDWTNKTLVVDLENSLGEKYHFEIEPNEEDKLPTRPSTSPGSKDFGKGVFLFIQMPLL